jgi:hypothetical protein
MSQDGLHDSPARGRRPAPFRGEERHSRRVEQGAIEVLERMLGVARRRPGADEAEPVDDEPAVERYPQARTLSQGPVGENTVAEEDARRTPGVPPEEVSVDACDGCPARDSALHGGNRLAPHQRAPREEWPQPVEPAGLRSPEHVKHDPAASDQAHLPVVRDAGHERRGPRRPRGGSEEHGETGCEQTPFQHPS